VKEPVVDKSDHLKFMVCSVFGVGANMLLFFKGLANTVPINGAVLMTCTPIFVVVIAAIYGTEKLSWSKLVGVLIATTGATLLIAGPDLQFSSETAAGDIMVTINAIIYSFYLVYSRPLMSKYNPITVSKWTFLYGSIFVLPFGFAELSEVQWSGIPSKIWVYTGFIIIISSFVTYLLNAWSLRHGSSSLVGSYIYLQPVLTTLFAELAGEDKMTYEKAGYTLLIFAGVFLVNYKLYKKSTV
jgi:drug/metabolite transporter (DMT)-like permease